MATFQRSAAVWCAMVFLVVPAAVVCAQAPAGVGAVEPLPPPEEHAAGDQDQQPAEDAAAAETQDSPPAEGDPVPPRPAGVPDSEAPKAEGKTADPQTDEGEPAAPPAFSGGAMRAGVGTVRPFGGMFRGAAPGQADLGHTLNLSASAFGVHARGDSPGLLESGETGGGWTTYGGSSLALMYGHNWTQASVGAFGTGGLAYVPEYDDRDLDPWITRWTVGGNGAFTRQLARRVRANGSGQVAYSPYLQQDLLFQASVPTVAPPLIGTPGLDFALSRDPSVRTTVEGSLSYDRTQRSSIDVYYLLDRRNFVTSDHPAYYTQLAGGRYVHRLNPWVGVRAGYGFRTAHYGGRDDDPIHSHELELGADGGYGRSFSLARRTTFSFHTGSSLFLRDRFQEDGRETHSGTRLFVNGSAALVHGWGRTWSANAGLRRSVSYEVGFQEPLLSNAVYAGMGGLLTPRLDFTALANLTGGSVGFGSDQNGFTTSSATAALRLALTEWLAAYAQYFLYRYDFESNVVLPEFLRRGHERQGVSVGLTTSFSLIGPRGRP